MRALLLLLVLTGCACEVNEQNIAIRGESLLPMLPANTEAVLQHGHYSCNEPRHGEIVAYNYRGNGAPVAKIVKGVPGDNWSLVGQHIMLNGEALTNSQGIPYVLDRNEKGLLSLYADDYPTIPKNTYLILGDNPTGSLDATRFGLVDRSDLVGRIVLK